MIELKNENIKRIKGENCSVTYREVMEFEGDCVCGNLRLFNWRDWELKNPRGLWSWLCLVLFFEFLHSCERRGRGRGRGREVEEERRDLGTKNHKLSLKNWTGKWKSKASVTHWNPHLSYFSQPATTSCISMPEITK